jgi:hypothetical protein
VGEGKVLEEEYEGGNRKLHSGGCERRHGLGEMLETVTAQQVASSWSNLSNSSAAITEPHQTSVTSSPNNVTNCTLPSVCGRDQ